VKASGLGNRKKPKNKVQIQATRKSLRLKGQGGASVEEMAIRGKQLHNLDIPGTTHTNSFAILNNIDDDALIQKAKELDIRLASDGEGCKATITIIKHYYRECHQQWF
jgi:hypothetical protein